MSYDKVGQMDHTRRRHFIEGLRAVAVFYEQNPDAYYDGMHITLNMYGAARHTLCEMARMFGQYKKSYDDRNVTVSKQFNEQITLSVSAPSGVEIIEWQWDPLLPDEVRIS
jgi:hypothetical protein